MFGSAALAALLVLGLGGTALAGRSGAAASAQADSVAAAEVGALAASAGCGRAPGLASGTRTISSGGQSRSYILRIPANYNQNNPYRLVLGFHWWGGTAVDVDTGQTVQRDVWSYYGLQRLANNSTIFVAPQGIGNGWANSGGSDVTFVDAILAQIEANLCVETTQRFAVGFSYGGAMSYALACARANVFRAVAVYGAPRELSGCSGGTQPIAYFGAHGIGDNIASGRALRDRFVRNNGCTAQNPPEPPGGSLSHRTTTYSGCRAGYPVVWAAFDGGHIAAPQDGAPGDSGSRTWLPGETWNFFTQFGGGTTPPPNPTTPPPNPTTPPPGGTSACRVAVTVNAWNNGLTEDITVTNTGSSAINGWSLVFTLPGGQTITGGWNASYSPTSGQVTARNVSYNGSIAPGASVGIGFQATHTGNSGRPSSFSLNGSTCTIA
ncbi:cellulose-binding protein [Micromonospora endophytica]|uniref:Cellulose-binding protein n=3 Tax=Micromonospora endophytica TaxID=515350 RepID=A0A2W2DJ32_9ACTN|nr:cellulose-binding protein [Micromonospora endophytica]